MSDDSPWKPPAPGEPPTIDEPPAIGESGTDGNPTVPTEPLPVLPPAAHAVAPNSFARPDGADSSPVEEQIGAPFELQIDGGETPTTETSPDDTPESGGSNRSAKVVAIAAAAIIAVGLAGIFAVRGLTGETASGGATPTELGEELLDAIEGEDMLGVIDLLLPGERETLGEPLIETASELQRLEVLASDLDLASLSGIDIVLADRVVGVESTNVGDVVHVRLAAEATITVDGAEVPIGDLISDNVPEEEMTELRGSRTTETESFDFELTAVEDDGRWYFSAWYSAAELAREEAGLAEIPAVGVGAVGADTPEALLDRWVEQVETLDLRGMIQSLDPFEAAALQRYAPLFIADAESAIAEFDGAIVVTESTFRFEGSGSSRTVFVDSLAIEASADDAALSVEYADGCYRATLEFDGSESESGEVCGGDVDLGEQLAELELPPEVGEFLQTIADAFADIEPIGAELRERDGEWYLSPIGTMSEAWLKALRALDRSEIDAIIGDGQAAFETSADDLFGSGGSIGGVFDDALGGGDSTFDDGWADEGSVDDDWSDEGAADTTIAGDPGATDDDPVSVCYETVDAGEATACFDELIATGQAEPWVVPTALRYPECGLADVMWSGDIYTATDEEFVALVTEATPCFEALVADGTMEEWDLPYEVANFECFENRNWYSVFDDAEYNDRVLECLDL